MDERCEHGVWKGDHCYRCGEAKAASGEPTLFFCGPRVALTNAGDPSTWEWHEYDPATMGWRQVKQPNIQRAFAAPKWDDLSDAQKTEAALKRPDKYCRMGECEHAKHGYTPCEIWQKDRGHG